MTDLKEGAIFLSDSHFLPSSKKPRDVFSHLINHPPPQLFLMGDIFHLLLANVRSCYGMHKEILELLDCLSKICDMYYLEGNHDFSLGSMKFLRSYPRSLQPLLFSLGDGRVALLDHGDKFISWRYELYIRFMNLPVTLSFLKLLDRMSFGSLYHKAQMYVEKKNPHLFSLPPIREDSSEFFKDSCRMDLFNDFIQFRLNSYYKILPSVLSSYGLHDAQIHQVFVLEGHFHIPSRVHKSKTDPLKIGEYPSLRGNSGEGIERSGEVSARSGDVEMAYLPLPSFACENRILRYTKDGFRVEDMDYENKEEG